MDKYTTRGDSGCVDLQASAKQYLAALTDWVAKNELPADTVNAALNAVFDRYPGQRIPMQMLISLTAQELGAGPSDHKMVAERVRATVKAQAANGQLSTALGAKGGTCRMAEVPARPTK